MPTTAIARLRAHFLLFLALLLLLAVLITPGLARAQVTLLRDAQGHPYYVQLGYDSSTGVSCVPGPSAPTCVVPGGSGVVGGGGSLSAKANAAAQSSAEGATSDPLSMDLHRSLRVLNVDSAGYPISTVAASSYTFEVAASDNHQVVKNGAGTVWSLDSFSTHTAAMFIRLYDLGTGFNGCNSATGLLWEGNIPGAATGAGFVHPWPTGKAFTTGLAVCVTGAFGKTDTTSATASKASINIDFN